MIKDYDQWVCLLSHSLYVTSWQISFSSHFPIVYSEGVWRPPPPVHIMPYIKCSQGWGRHDTEEKWQLYLSVYPKEETQITSVTECATIANSLITVTYIQKVTFDQMLFNRRNVMTLGRWGKCRTHDERLLSSTWVKFFLVFCPTTPIQKNTA